MSNLLPTAEKRLLLREYRLRVGIALLYSLGALAAIGVVSLAPSLVRIYSLVSSAERGRALEEATLEQLGASTVLSGFREASEELAALAPTLRRPDLAYLVRTVVLLRPSGVSIQSIAYEPRSGAAGTLILGGTASLRDDLLQFVDSLRREAAFATVDLPIENLARERDVTFTLSATIQSNL